MYSTHTHAHSCSLLVPRSRNSVVIGNLDSDVEYAVSVGVVNEENIDLTGPTGEPIVVAPPTLGEYRD